MDPGALNVIPGHALVGLDVRDIDEARVDDILDGIVAFPALALASTVFFVPLAAGLPISAEAMEQRVWLDSWFYPHAELP